MISTLFKVAAGTIACASLATPSFAGVYANVENNSGFTGNDFNAGSTDLHLGVEGPVSDSVSLYIQGGPSLQHADGIDTETEYSGKLGGSIAVTERFGVYAEVSALTTDQDFEFDNLNVGTKIGAKFTF